MIRKYLSQKTPGRFAYMLGSKGEEIKYVKHNSLRYNEALDYIDKLVSKKEKFSILDIGTSPFTFLLRKRYPKATVYSADYSDKFARDCRNNHIFFKRVDLQQRNLPRIASKFDIVTFLEVVEHLKMNHRRVVKWISINLKNNGVCIIQTPNKYSFKSFVLMIISDKLWGKVTESKEKDPEFYHHKEFSMKEIIKLISSTNSKIVEAKYSLYFDDPSSALAYHQGVNFLKPFFLFSYQLVKVFPQLRRGMQIVFKK